MLYHVLQKGPVIVMKVLTIMLILSSLLPDIAGYFRYQYLVIVNTGKVKPGLYYSPLERIQKDIREFQSV